MGTQGGEGVALVPGSGAAIIKAEADVAPAACFQTSAPSQSQVASLCCIGPRALWD